MRQTSVFGKRKEPHTVIIARGDEIRHFTVRPWAMALAGSAVAAIAVGYLLATTYLVLRDDLIGASVARQARVQQAYEDRIAALRAQVDRITSRQLLDQQLMENKVSELLARQTQLTQRHGRIGPILEKARTEKAAKTILPTPRPASDTRAALDGVLTFAAATRSAAPFASLLDPATPAQPSDSVADRADKTFVAINQSLKAIETEQLTRIRTMADDANQTADQIAAALTSAGLSVDAEYGADAGGPLVSAGAAGSFDDAVENLDEALSKLDTVKSAVRRLPIANPAPGQAISSTFGLRRDPILGIRAMHSGMDFRAPVGMIARATAAGTVIHAGWNGGYGKMVEIRHEGGFTTRYAHMSGILVKEGETVDAGEPVGKVGSTGRSTGPHLHYEVRTSSGPVDPVRFIKAGRKVEGLL